VLSFLIECGTSCNIILYLAEFTLITYVVFFLYKVLSNTNLSTRSFFVLLLVSAIPIVVGVFGYINAMLVVSPALESMADSEFRSELVSSAHQFALYSVYTGAAASIVLSGLCLLMRWWLPKGAVPKMKG